MAGYSNERRLHKDIKLIKGSGLFDASWYLSTYPEVAGSGESPELHYLLRGGFEGYDPCEIFSSSAYLEQYPDVREAGMNPLVHYVTFGKKEGRSVEVSEQAGNVAKELIATKQEYYRLFGCLPDLTTPVTFSEKILAYKLFYTEQDLGRFVDKGRVREFVAKTIGEKYLIPMIGIFSDPDDIDLKELPDQFVIKATHGSGWNAFCSSKANFDWAGQKKILREWLNSNFYDRFFESAYMNVPPRLLIEHFIHDEYGIVPRDYKFFCFNGEPALIQVDSDRFSGHNRNFYDLKWNLLNVRGNYPNNQGRLEKPANLAKMLEVSRCLSAGFPFVRVDLYAIPEVYFGELSFYPEAGFLRLTPVSWDKKLGECFEIQKYLDESCINLNGSFDPLDLFRVRSERFGFDFSSHRQDRPAYTALANQDLTSYLFRQMVRGVKTYIDADAGCGFYALLAAKSNPELDIHCFESAPVMQDLLQTNLADNHVQASINDELLREIVHGPALIRMDGGPGTSKTLERLKGTIEHTADVRLLIHDLDANSNTAPRFLEGIFAKLEQWGFDLFVVDEENRIYRRYPSAEEDTRANKPGPRSLVAIKKEQSLNLLFFSHSANLFGAERSLLDLTASLTRRFGVLCTVALPEEGPLKQALESAGVATRVIPYRWWCAPSGYLPADKDGIDRTLSESYQAMREHSQAIAGIGADLVVTSTLVIPWGALTAKNLDVPHIWWVKEFGQLDHGLEFYLPFEKTLEVIDEASNYIVVPSKALKDTLFEKVSAEKAIVAYNLKPVFTGSDRMDETFFVDDQALKLLIFGLVMPSKGQEEAIQAVDRLLQEGRNVELCILGDSSNPYGEHLKEYVRSIGRGDQIHFHEFTTNVRGAIEQSDIGLVCSRNEAFGRVTVEAMMLGKPVIGTRSGGTIELIEDGSDGLLYDPGNLDQLVEKIEFFLASPGKVVEFGERAQQNILRKLDEKPVDDLMYQLSLGLKKGRNPGSAKLSDLAAEWEGNVPKAFKARISDLEKKISDLEGSIREIESSKKWKLALRLYGIRNALVPEGSLQDRVIQKIFKKPMG